MEFTLGNLTVVGSGSPRTVDIDIEIEPTGYPAEVGQRVANWDGDDIANFIDEVTYQYGWKVLGTSVIKELAATIAEELQGQAVNGDYITDHDARNLAAIVAGRLRR